MPIYPKPNGTFRVRVWIRGQRFDRIAPTKPDAQRLEAEMRLELGADAPTSRGRHVPTLSQLCVGPYRQHAEVELAPQTWSVRQYRIATLCEVLGNIRVDKLAAGDVLRFVNVRKATCTNATIADDLKILKAILEFGRRIERLPIPRVPMPTLRVPQRSARDRTKAWTDDEVTRLLKACAKVSPHIADLVLLVAESGVRKTEAIRLRWDAVDLDARTAWVEPVDEDGVTWEPKTESSTRVIPLSAAVVGMLRARQRVGPWVFATTRLPGRPLATWPQFAFDRARKEAGLEGGPHTLRHSFASRFLRAGGTLFELGRILGHSSQRTTEIYAHMVPDHVADMGAVVDRASVKNRTRDRTRRGAAKTTKPRKP